MFRDWLRTHPDDLALYAETKLAAASAATEAEEHVMDDNRRTQPVVRAVHDRMFRAHGLIT